MGLWGGFAIIARRPGFQFHGEVVGKTFLLDFVVFFQHKPPDFTRCGKGIVAGIIKPRGAILIKGGKVDSNIINPKGWSMNGITLSFSSDFIVLLNRLR
jgi:hypothetical protein